MSAWECLQTIFRNIGLDFVVEVNNLGGRDSLKLYNRALVEILQESKHELSEVSRVRLDSGQAVRILESKSE